LATVFYAKTQVASPENPFNKWQTHVFIGETKLEELLIQASDNDEKLYVNKYGEIRQESKINPAEINGGVSKLFNLDDLSNPQQSLPATASGSQLPPALNNDWKSGIVPATSNSTNPVVSSTFKTSSNSDAVNTTVTTLGVIPVAGSLSIDMGSSGTPPVLTATASFTPAGGSEVTGLVGTVSADGKTVTFSGSPLAEPGKTFSVATGTPLVSGNQLAIGLKSNSLNFVLNVDSSAAPITINLNHLIDSNAELNKNYTGVEIAREITNAISKAYGDERFFDFTSLKTDPVNGTDADLFKVALVNTGASPSNDPTQPTGYKIINISDSDALAVYGTGKTLANLTSNEAASLLQTKLRTQLGDENIKVGYDPVLKSFTFKTTTPGKEFILSSATTSNNEFFNLSTGETRVDTLTGAYAADLMPRGDFVVPPTDQRYGITVTFDDTTRRFLISSGSTGDTSSVEISNASDNANTLFGFPKGNDVAAVDISRTPLRGIPSTPAVLNGNPIGINVSNKFRVDGSNNQFVVTVNNVTGVVTMPEKADYTIEEFRRELEFRINSLSDNFGRSVNGVVVDVQRNALGQSFFNFTTGTTGNDAFLKVSANSIWGLADLESARGTTSRWVEPPQARNAAGFPLYVNRDGLETSDPGDFSEIETADLWSPIFLDKGELTFSTNGNLQSPSEAIRFKASTIGETGATLQFAINYSGSTQFSSPFSVLAQSQNGRPEGDLIGLNIGDDGLVSANYSNGTQKNLAKIILANFTAPTGLRQLGDSSYLATSQSGRVTLGEAGAAGFGTVRAGATERANVDLTQELIELITAQRNFQANAKAIETNNTLTQAIINIRS